MGILYFKDKPIVGLDISQTGVKIMAINPKRSTVSAYGSIDLDPAKVEESLKKSDDYLETNIKTLLSKELIGSLPSNHIVMGLPTC